MGKGFPNSAKQVDKVGKVIFYHDLATIFAKNLLKFYTVQVDSKHEMKI